MICQATHAVTQFQTWRLSCSVAQQSCFCGYETGGNSIFAANANNKVAGILAAYPKAVKEGKELKSVKGVGKGSMDKVK